MGYEYILSEYEVDYILIGSQERYHLSVDEYAIANRYDKVYESDWGEMKGLSASIAAEGSTN